MATRWGECPEGSERETTDHHLQAKPRAIQRAAKKLNHSTAARASARREKPTCAHHHANRGVTPARMTVTSPISAGCTVWSKAKRSSGTGTKRDGRSATRSRYAGNLPASAH